MHNLLNQLVAIDKKGREIVLEAEELRLQAKIQIQDQAQKTKEEFKGRAERHIESSRQSYSDTMAKKLKEIEIAHDKALAEVNKNYEAHHLQWVEQITKRVIQGLS